MNLFAPGQNDPQRLTRGPRPTARPRWPARPERPWPWRQRPGTMEGRRSGARGRRGRGPAGPGAHQGHSGEVSLAGDGMAAANSAAASSDACGEMATGGDDSDHLGPIPSRGRKRVAMRTSGHAQRRSGRFLAAAGGVGHGASSGTERRAREGEEG
jgi:hypothetical protein